ncbi:MAG: methyltransferase [Gammaproteobacteria bacterium]|nr:methyltransferase [Gammaproteobacteria bacterium]
MEPFAHVSPSLQVNDKVVWDIICGMIGFPAIFVAHELKLFSLLDCEPQTTSHICATLHTDRRATEAMLTVCAALGLIEQVDQRYRLTATANAYLLESSPTYMGGFLDLIIGNHASISIDSLRNAMKSGATQAYGGGDIFESHAEMDERARVFTRAMHSASVAPAQHWPQHLDLSTYHTMLDIGGGSGAHTIGALKQWPQLQGIVFDIPPVCDVAGEIAAANDLGNRISTHNGDLWNSDFPTADIHFYSQIYHDWPEDKCRFLTEKSFKALNSGGRIIIHEMLYDNNKSGPFVAAASSIGMLLWTQGRQYSGMELSQILSDAGFKDIKIIPTHSYWSIVTAVKS